MGESSGCCGLRVHQPGELRVHPGPGGTTLEVCHGNTAGVSGCLPALPNTHEADPALRERLRPNEPDCALNVSAAGAGPLCRRQRPKPPDRQTRPNTSAPQGLLQRARDRAPGIPSTFPSDQTGLSIYRPRPPELHNCRVVPFQTCQRMWPRHWPSSHSPATLALAAFAHVVRNAGRALHRGCTGGPLRP